MPKIILIAIVLAALGYFGYTQYFTKTYISSDTTVQELKVDKGKTLIIKNGAKVTVDGNADIDGSLECEEGPLNLVVQGDLSINNKLKCERKDKDGLVSDNGVGISIVSEGSLMVSEKAQIVTNGHIFLVDSANHLPASAEDIEKLYAETGMDTDDGKMRIGPLGPDEEDKDTRDKDIDTIFKQSPFKIPDSAKKSGLNLVNTASAQGSGNVVLNGDWVINTPPRGVYQVIIFTNYPNRSMEINGTMVGPNGHDAEPVKGGCFIDVPTDEEEDEEENNGRKNKEKNALRFRARSGKVIIGNFKLTLGNGGKGADAETDVCEVAVAIAGTGGKSGNMKITAGTEIMVRDNFTLIPGKGGRGGDATAHGKKGKDGNPGKMGGYTAAGGGFGANNIKKLKALGNVKGLDKIFVGPVIGGDGGDGIVNPGDGGDGNVCDAKGGPAGQGYAEDGWGGFGSVELPPQVKRTPGAKDDFGDNGKAMVNEAKPGKDGPPCGGGGDGEPLPSPPPTPTPSPTPFPGYKTEAPTPASWEFLRIDKNYEKTNTLKLDDVPIHLIVATNGQLDVTTFLPITIILKVDGNEEFKTTISGDPKKVCRGPTGCSTDGPVMKKEWKNKPIELSAYTKDGKILARWTE